MPDLLTKARESERELTKQLESAIESGNITQQDRIITQLTKIRNLIEPTGQGTQAAIEEPFRTRESKTSRGKLRLEQAIFGERIWDKYKTPIIGLILFILLIGPGLTAMLVIIQSLQWWWFVIAIVAIIIWYRR